MGVMIHSPLLSLQTHSYLIKEEPCPFAMQAQVYGITLLPSFHDLWSFTKVCRKKGKIQVFRRSLGLQMKAGFYLSHFATRVTVAYRY